VSNTLKHSPSGGFYGYGEAFYPYEGFGTHIAAIRIEVQAMRQAIAILMLSAAARRGRRLSRFGARPAIVHDSFLRRVPQR